MTSEECWICVALCDLVCPHDCVPRPPAWRVLEGEGMATPSHTDVDGDSFGDSEDSEHHTDASGMWDKGRPNVRPRLMAGGGDALSGSGSYADGEVVEWTADNKPAKRKVLGPDGKWTLVVVGGSVMSEHGVEEEDDDEGSSRPGSRATGHVSVTRAGPGARHVRAFVCAACGWCACARACQVGVCRGVLST